MPFTILPKPAGSLTSLLLVLLLAGCASAPKWPSGTDGNPSLQTRTVLDEVPFYPQERYQCGPASLAMMLNSQGLETNPEVLRDLVYIPGREGSLQVEMVAAGRAHNMLVYTLDGSLESLLKEVAAGNPVLVMQNLLFNWLPQWHFAVVIGFDAQKQTIILHTDTRERHETSVEVFSNTWSRSDNWAAVMLPPDRIPASAEPLAYLASANDLETTGRTNAAMTAYQTAERQWPDQPAAILGQGNIAYTRQNLQEATSHFARLVSRFPREAVGWNNLAHTLGETGCLEEAKQAQRCASALAPDRFGAQIDPGTAVQSPSDCPTLDCPALTTPQE
ncbi:PA2778 family cysteine peptidase [Marinobacter sp. M216]|uniref:PA2778 family cysteine peptidase n=1 Tax=Marinobacter albus TaxID=3030833 RepID=A0ABT7HFM6_9GAMM|nr:MULTISPECIES: PA2778 family cysteine peptidase [unclassified Marinobacter]MBW7472630.1 PA2778 family cysteine peptidase [Marinobacter sp. F4218]MDK9559183.1 PA2778 family cysteine peptidase [Marinobacter sp. M216]